MLCQVLQESGLPNGVINMVFGTGPKVGMPLVCHPDVPAISFTGGTVTGKIIYQQAAAGNKKLSLELGGKNANIIFQDANLKEAINTSVRSSFANQGEICLCGSRIFVHQDVYDFFVNEFTKQVNQLVVGDPLNEETHIGAIVSSQHLEKVLYYINLAKEEGGYLSLLKI